MAQGQPEEWGPPNAKAPTPGSSYGPKKPGEFPKQTPPHIRSSQPVCQSWVPYDSPFASDGTLAEGGMQAPGVRTRTTMQGGRIMDSYGPLGGQPGAGRRPIDGDPTDA